jgi:hypothetical protein
MFVPHAVAVNAYVSQRQRLPVELSLAARAYIARYPLSRSTAGLAELEAYAAFNPKPFVTKAENDESLLLTMAFARRVQIAKELAASLRQ